MLTRDYSDPDWREFEATCPHMDGWTVLSSVGYVELRECDACKEQVPVDTREEDT